MPEFIPTERQRQFLLAIQQYDEIGFGGARGGAKSVALCAAAHQLSTLFPGNYGLIVRKNLTDLRRTTLKTMRAFMSKYYPHQPHEWQMSPELELRIYSGGQWSTIGWVETKDPDKLRSANLGWVALEEATEISEDFYLMISAALGRHELPDGTKPPTRLLWASNPGPGWCKDLFPVGPKPAVDTSSITDRDGKKVYIRRAFVPALPKDNPHLPADFEAKLREKYSDIWVKRWVEGDWDAFEGQVFHEFDESKHVLDYVPDVTRFEDSISIFAHDWGFRAPAAALSMSIDSDGAWWFTDEHYESDKTPHEHAPRLWEMLAQRKRWAAQLIDYAAQDQTTGTSVQTIYNGMQGYKFQFAPCKKAKHGADGSIHLFKRLLSDGLVRISPACVNFIAEIKKARWKELSASQQADRHAPEQMVDKDDHLLDCCFMGLEFWREVPRQVTDEMRRQREIQAKRTALDLAILRNREQERQDREEGKRLLELGKPKKQAPTGWRI